MPDSLWPYGRKPTSFLCPVRFPTQEYWSELPFPPPGDLPNPGIKPESPVVPVAGGFFTTDHLRSPTCQHRHPPVMPSTSGSLSSLPFHPRFQGQRDPAGSWRKTSSLVPVSLPAGLLPTRSRWVCTVQSHLASISRAREGSQWERSRRATDVGSKEGAVTASKGEERGGRPTTWNLDSGQVPRVSPEPQADPGTGLRVWWATAVTAGTWKGLGHWRGWIWHLQLAWEHQRSQEPERQPKETVGPILSFLEMEKTSKEGRKGPRAHCPTLPPLPHTSLVGNCLLPGSLRLWTDSGGVRAHRSAFRSLPASYWLWEKSLNFSR